MFTSNYEARNYTTTVPTIAVTTTKSDIHATCDAFSVPSAVTNAPTASRTSVGDDGRQAAAHKS